MMTLELKQKAPALIFIVLLLAGIPFGVNFFCYPMSPERIALELPYFMVLASCCFVEETKSELGIMGMGRRVEEQEADRCVLRENFEPYSAVFDPKNGCLSLNNSYLWDDLRADSMS